MHRQTTIAALLLFPMSIHAAPIQSELLNTISEEVEQLKNPNQAARDKAASKLRDIYKQNPSAANDMGEPYWRKQFEAVKLGMKYSEIRKVTGAAAPSDTDAGECTGDSCLYTLRLDDYWSAVLTSSQSRGLLSVDKLSRWVRHIWIGPPKNFSGKWISYYVNGAPFHEIQYSNGVYVHFRTLHDNGLVSTDVGFSKGLMDGTETKYYSDGKKLYEARYIEGKRVGSSIAWYPDGQKKHETIYKNDRMTSAVEWYPNGQKSFKFEYDDKGNVTCRANWDRNGTLRSWDGSLDCQSAGPKK